MNHKLQSAILAATFGSLAYVCHANKIKLDLSLTKAFGAASLLALASIPLRGGDLHDKALTAAITLGGTILCAGLTHFGLTKDGKMQGGGHGSIGLGAVLLVADSAAAAVGFAGSLYVAHAAKEFFRG